MRILAVQPYADRAGHYGEYTARVSQEMAKLGHAVTLCTNRLDPRAYLREDPHFEIVEFGDGRYDFAPFEGKKSRVPFLYDYGVIKNGLAVMSLAFERLRTQGFDILHLYGYELVTAWLRFSRFRGKLPPVTIEISAANFAFDKRPGSILRKSYTILRREALERMLGRYIKAMIVLGDWHKEELPRQLNLPDPHFPIYVVPQGTEIPEPFLPREQARERVGLGGYTGPVLLLFGILRNDKAPFRLFEALVEVRSDFRLLVAGLPHDWTAEKVLRSVRALGLADRVVARLEYIPNDEIKHYFFASDVVLLPYTRLYTGGSGPLMKACAHGRPVIVTDVSEMGQLTRKHGLGLISRTEESRDLLAAIQQFLGLPETAKAEFRENGLSLARKCTWQSMAAGFVNIYQEILRHNQSL